MATLVTKVQSVRKVTEVTQACPVNQVLAAKLKWSEVLKVKKVFKDLKVRSVILVFQDETVHPVMTVSKVSQVTTVPLASKDQTDHEVTAVCEEKKAPLVSQVFPVKTVLTVLQVSVAKKLNDTASFTLDIARRELFHNAQLTLTSFGMATVCYTPKATNEPTLRTWAVPVLA